MQSNLIQFTRYNLPRFTSSRYFRQWFSSIQRFPVSCHGASYATVATPRTGWDSTDTSICWWRMIRWTPVNSAFQPHFSPHASTSVLHAWKMDMSWKQKVTKFSKFVSGTKHAPFVTGCWADGVHPQCSNLADGQSVMNLFIWSGGINLNLSYWFA